MRKNTLQRKPKNQAEGQLYDLMNQDGWFVEKKGFPDFACYRNDEFILVEVKPKRGHRLKKAQYRLMTTLAKAGIKCYRWTPEDGFTLVTPSIEHL